MSIQHTVSPQEWQLRVDLAACYRLVALYGWSDLIFTHISAGIPDSDHQFLINPYGLMFEEVTASNLIRIDQEGNKISDSPHPINKAGFTIHSCIHAARPDVGCVLHTHTRAGVAVSAQKNGLLPISQQSTFVLSSLSYHNYEGVAIFEGEKPRLQADLGDSIFYMLRNHGLLTAGGSIADAFMAMYVFETACQIQLAAQSGGTELIQVDPRIIEGVGHALKTQTEGLGGAFAWPALLRKLDKIDPSYAT